MSPDLGEVRLDRKSLRRQALEVLRARIIEGTIRPGERLVETRLSDQLQISRGTLREALRHLEQEGLVVSNRRGQLRVRVLTPREVHEIYEVRTALESTAAAAVARDAGRREAIDDLYSALEPLRETGRPFPAQIEADLSFHRRLCESSGNRTLVGTWVYLSSQIRATIVAAGPEVAGENMGWQRHAAILAPIERGDAAGAYEVLAAHMREAASRIAETVEIAGDV